MQIKGKDISISVEGLTICYDDLGIGDIPILFIHGFPFDKSTWQPQTDYFKSSQRVIAYDIRGFGKSSADKEEASMKLFGDDLIKFMDALEINRAVVCGLSMGGYILMNAIQRYPKRFKAIILSDTQCIADNKEAKEKRNKTIEQIKAVGLADFAEGFIKNAFCKDSLTDKKELVEKIRKIILSTAPAIVTGTLTALAERYAMCSFLTDISIPALILCGKEDVITPVAQSEFLQSKIKNSTFQIIDGAGHLSNLEQQDEFNKHVNNFISSFGKW
jgi:3-oxoadipate enol-lactonase